MDGNRFDTLTRSLVGPRRAALRALAGAALGAALARVGLAETTGLAACKPAGGKCKKAGDCCSRRCRKRQGKKTGKCQAGGNVDCAVGSDGVLTHATQTQFAGKPLRLEQSSQPLGARGQTANLVTLTLDGAPLLTQAITGAGGQVTLMITYGDAFSGIGQAQFTNDGKMVRGAIDGRAIRPLPIDAGPNQVEFADGGPPPDVQVDPDLAQAIKAIMQQAKEEARRCDPDSPAAGRRGAGRRGGRRLGAAGGDPTQAPECLALYVGCQGGLALCVYGVVSACAAATLFYPICIAGGLLACALGAELCRREFRHGDLCCPVQCGGEPVHALYGEDPGCCEEGDTCLDEDDSASRCCPPSFRSCHRRTCCFEEDGCQPDGICCLQGQSSCQGVCCSPGSCSPNGCCVFPDHPCGEGCCGPFQTCCDGACCASGQTCCNGRCCNGTCINNTCCPAPNQNCGGTCCGNACCNNVCCRRGESCDPVSGRCAARCNPDLGIHPCPNDPRYPACCPALFTCCTNGECCGPGQECCAGAGGGFCGFPPCEA